MKFSSFFAATTLIAGIVATILWQQLHAERAKTAQFLEERSAQLDVTRLQKVQSSNSVPTASETPTFTAAPSDDVPTQIFRNQPAAQNYSGDPDYCRARRDALRAQLVRAYPNVGKVLTLSHKETTALIDLLLQQQESRLATCLPDGTRNQAGLTLAGQAQTPETRIQARDAEVQALLSATKYQEWLEYLPTREVRQSVIQLRNATASNDIPLTDQQAESLLAAALSEDNRLREEMISRVRPTSPGEMIDFDEEHLRMLEQSQTRLLSSASYLDPQQIAVMKDAMAQEIATQRISLRTRRALLGSRGNADSVASPTTP